MEKITQTKHLRVFTGIVISTGMKKTATVKVDTMKMNEKYQKKYTVSKKYHVHDEQNSAKVGDTVTFAECRPLSKTKRWRLISTKQ
ncbi:MAG: 30S ribosomal protein S17 [Candidatus Magasanikbacteria bacterium GW2011_GWA2_50_22]|uniref:Small ribosomal subunit protein uS17 n=1 Tax=Candidatus Magasanikbacteria bacterium GW2011_GWA2_50_22 TaxID=1619043 RepID=A0A0G1WFR0_9BACT|nr:MAG: 30S ribosomal protein S17 [Candidatus Magasanikbacteria bacterium GW2011_GWA2_50_22]